MGATKIFNGSEAYQHFQIILYRWLRFVGLIMGHDIFQEHFEIHSHTVFMSAICLSVPIVFFLTSYRFDNELGMAAGAFVVIGLKVRSNLISAKV